MKLATYLLMFLCLSTQFDDAWVAAACAESQTAAEDDEYLLAYCQQLRARCFFDLSSHGAVEFSSARLEGSPPSGPPPADVFFTPPLYVFMSLQC
jgi:hypothetical protein